jgi:predicted PurR-regulated permease PerM
MHHLGVVKKVLIAIFKFLRWSVRSRLPRPVAVVVALLLAVMVIAVLMVVVFSSVNELVAHSEKYTERIHAMVDWIVKMGGSMGVNVSNQAIIEKLLNHTGFISELLIDTLRLALEELTNGFLMLLFTVYLLLGYAPDERRQTGSVRAEVEMQVKRYIGYKVLLSASTGILVAASLLLLRVDLALVFGLLAFLLNFIPNVGSVISVILPMPVVIFDPSKTWVDIWLAFIIPTLVSPCSCCLRSCVSWPLPNLIFAHPLYLSPSIHRLCSTAPHRSIVPVFPCFVFARPFMHQCLTTTYVYERSWI